MLALLIHGDAAFAGQGVVAECFGLSGLRGHRTGGSVHFIVNNQIGFTTYPRYSRSSPYPSDVAKLVEAPIFHVNGDDPEAVVFCAKVATEYRQRFHKPVVIDMFCYRRFGHNEGDEPAFTQPLMYRAIRAHPTTLQIYAEKLIDEGVVTQGEVDKMRADWRQRLEAEFEAGQAYVANKADWLDGRWSGFKAAQDLADDDRRGQTGVDARPAEVHRRAHHRARRKASASTRRSSASSTTAAPRSIAGEGIDWATGEALAFGSLLDEGFPVRLSGQDSERGTFSQRHSVLIDQETEARYIPLNHIRDGQARYEVINSMLSEEAVLGFEYGYSLAEPNALTLWEAQFGDFANGAQVVFDQFISSGERKWLRMSGLVCLLPHGYEGQGPEHSSARLERYLQLCAEDNMQVVYLHDAGQFLPRAAPADQARVPQAADRDDAEVDAAQQARGVEPGRLRGRHELPSPAVGPRRDPQGREDQARARRQDPPRRDLCSGKVYYDLYEEREKRGVDDVYLLRVEQLYPFPLKALVKELSRFKKAEIVWCQEEPKNMGAWTFVEPYLEWVLGPGRRQVEARALRRPAGRRRDGDRPDVQASRAAEGVPRRVLRVRGSPRASETRRCPRCRTSSASLTPPRPSFLADMTRRGAGADARRTASTGARMSRSGVVVGDGRRSPIPAGAWGVAIVEARSPPGVEALQARDPVDRCRRAASPIENFLMPTVAVRAGRAAAPSPPFPLDEKGAVRGAMCTWRLKFAFRRSASRSPKRPSANGSSNAATSVKADEPLVELETDKVTLEVNAPAAGVLTEIAAETGETVAIGALLGGLTAGRAPARPKPRRQGRRRAAPAASGRADRDAAGAVRRQDRGRERRSTCRRSPAAASAARC